MISAKMRKSAQDRLHREVGAFFTNTIRSADTCQVCTGPAVGKRCDQCEAQRLRYDGQLADQVILLAYAKGKMSPPHQSAHHMYRYKNRIEPSAECMRDLKLMMRAATLLHSDCIARGFGPWDVVTFVSSESRPGLEHPVVELARQVASTDTTRRILLDVGPDISAAPRRFPLPRRFTVPERWKRRVRDRHILVVDDTWVSGDKGQSAALVLKEAGARAVTIVCVARWLNWEYSEAHRQLIRLRMATYDALQCPVTGSSCP